MKNKCLILIVSLCFLNLSVFALFSYSKSSESGKDVNFKNIRTNSYYFGRIDEARVFIMFDSVSIKYASGKFFKLDNEIYANEIDFELKARKKSFILKTNDGQEELKITLQLASDLISGQYRVNDKFLGIFNRYSAPKDFRLGLYSEPEFIIYPDRYKKQIFDEITAKYNIIYGTARGYWDSYPEQNETYWKILERGILNTINKRILNLTFDIYKSAKDTLKYRPLIMFIHGGGFYIGDKQSKAFVSWSEHFASLGYVVVSINYRLGFKPINYSVERAGYRALQDAHAAMRYLVNNYDIYGIDTSLLFVAGSSAGGITSLNLAFMRNHNRPRTSFGSILLEDIGNIESSTNSLVANFNIKAVVNMWGAVSDINIFKNSKTSILSFHGTDDKVVPYFYDFPFKDIPGGISRVVFNKIYGSFLIHQKAKELGIREKLYTFDNLGHSPYVEANNYSVLNKNFYIIQDEITDFLYPEILPENNYITTIIPASIPKKQIAYRTQNEDFVKIHWKIQGGIIIGSANNMVRVVWFKDRPKYCLYLSTLHRTGARSFYRYEIE